MPRKLLLINAILIAIAAGSVVFIARQFMAPMPMPSAGKGRPASSTDAERAAETPRPSASAYGMVASKNLFSPSRTEAPVNPAAATAVANVPKPNLFGVVLRDGAPIAYLEDPTTKRVSGYRIGDAVAGGTVQAINADSVSISRPDGKMDVRLRDPGKPRPAGQPATAAITPGAQPVANQPLPGVIPPVAPPAAVAQPGVPPVAVPGQPPVYPQPGQAAVPQPVIPGRRPLPPNLLRRLPQVPTTDAPQQ
jgi:hypothetical protein